MENDKFKPFWDKLQIYAPMLANDVIDEGEVISIAYWRIIQYGKYAPDKLWVPLCRHISVETKKRRRKRKIPQDIHEQSVVHDSSQLTVDDILEGLSKVEKFLLIKHFVDGNTYEELGAVFDVSWMTIRNRVIKAIEKIRQRMGDYYE